MEIEDVNTQVIELKSKFYNSFGKLSDKDGRTLEFYYKFGLARGVDAYKYISEAINRTAMKKNLDKPISYFASLCKNFYKNGLYSQPSQEENDIIEYVESKIGLLSEDNKRLLQTAISTSGSVRVMSGAAEVLNNSKLQNKIMEEILLRIVELWK